MLIYSIFFSLFERIVSLPVSLAELMQRALIWDEPLLNILAPSRYNFIIICHRFLRDDIEHASQQSNRVLHYEHRIRNQREIIICAFAEIP